MELNWMGRYRPLIESLVKHRNLYARALNGPTESSGEISLTLLEWEVLEYIIEHEDDDESMIRISETLAIAQSSFSKITKALCEYKLIARYQMVGNRKNIILKPTEEGISFYLEHAEKLSEEVFGPFFKELDALSDDDIERVKRAVDALNFGILNTADDRSPELIKVD